MFKITDSKICNMSFNGICNFCFSDINNENAGLITDTTKEISDLLLMNLDLGDRSEQAICHVCSERLFAAFEFKSTCKYTDATIIPYVDWEKPTQLDLLEIYLRERDNKQTVTLSDDEKVCRLCMELTGKMYVPLQDIDKDVFQKFLPEINVNIVKDPVVCKTCFDLLVTHSKFLKKFKNCVEQQEAIQNLGYPRTLGHTDELLPIKMEEVDIKLEDKPSMDSCMQLGQIQPEIEEYEEIFIKNEDIKPEFEHDQTSIGSLASEIRPVAFESKQQTQTKQTETGSCKKKYGFCRSNDDMTQKHALETKLYKCDVCVYCTNNKKLFKCHQLIHKDPSQVQMYKCDRCDYETKIKKYLRSHQVKHKDPSEIQMYQCEFCDYKAKFKDRLKKHQLVHKDPSQVQMHKCDICSFETKYKQKLKYHQLVHKDPSEVHMYRCDICNYESKCKRYLRAHQLRHMDISEVQTYNCEICDYKTKVKGNLQKHCTVHQDPSKIKWFTCDFCDFRTKRESSFKYHQLLHKDPSQVQMHKCDICTYESIYKDKLKCHQLVHKDPSEVQMFSCDDCEYKTKFKNNLKKHQLKHKDPSEVQMYKCATCDYETKLKRVLKSHLLKHKGPSELQMFKCAECSYESKSKRNLSRHYSSQHRSLS